MGSFNVSCSVSDLPIMWNEKVKYGFIVETPHYDQIRSCGKYKFLLPFLIDGKYDDYGRCVPKNISDETRHKIDEFLRKNAIFEKNNETFSNTSTPMTRENLNIESIFEYLHEGILYFRQVNDFLARESLEFEDIYSKDIPYDQPMKVHPFIVRKDIFDEIISGVYDPQNCYLDENRKLVYEVLTFDGLKKKIFGDYENPTIKQFFTLVFESRKRFADVELTSDLFNCDSDKQQALLSELKEMVDSIEGSTFFTVNSISRSTRNDDEFEKIVRDLESSSDGDADDTRLLKLIDFFKKNKDVINLKSIHRQSVYETLSDSSADSGAKTAHFFHEFEPFFSETDLDIDEIKNFHVFFLWFDNSINGTVKPSRYAGQEFCTESYKQLFGACMNVINKHESDFYEDEEYDDDEEE